ncbi:MAG: ABC transporter permease [Phycisphaeraceae bacterium]|nr:ABC transporter permease [Phycisphaerales bacterium]MCB9842460.1 ABC transporter permease [Phycisphaeraceae bacterium]
MSDLGSRPSRWLWMIRPDKILFGPIFAKEVITSGRRASTYWTRGLFALAIAGLVSLFLWGHWEELRHEGVAQRLQNMQLVGPQLAWAIVWVQFVVVTLIAPALTAACISEESANRTLSALMTTPMTSAQIVMGKLASRMVQLVILGLLTLPALLLLRLLGGLETEAVVAGASLTMGAGFFAASVGLLLSVVNKRPWSVMVLSEVITAAVFVGPILVTVLFMALAGGGGPGATWLRVLGVLAHISPAVALGAVMGNANGAGIPVSSLQIWLSATGSMIVLGTLVNLLAVALTRRTMRAHMRGSVRSERKHKKGTRSRVSRTVSDDPVFWHEMRTKWVGNKWAAGIMGLIILGFLGWVFYTAWSNQEWEALHYAMLLMLGIAQLFMAMVSTTSRIATERQKRTWDVLMTTPLPAWRIVMGKLIAGIVRLMPVPILLAVYFSLFSLLGFVRWYTTVEIVFLISAWTIFLAASGLFWSSMFKRPIAASVVNMVTAAGLWMGAPMVMGFVFGAILQTDVGELWLMRAIVALNPFYMLYESLTGGIPSDYFGYNGDFPDNYDFVGKRLSPQAFLMVVIASGGAALAAALGLVVATSVRARAIPRRG